MPGILDRYLIRQYVQVFFICYVSLTGLYVMIDAFSHIDHFIDHADKAGGSVYSVLGRYYAFRAVAFFDRTSGILALVAAMFTVTWLQRHNEMTALMAAGVPRLRVLRPLIVLAALVSLSAAAGRELLVPRIRHELALDSKNLSGEATLPLESRWDNQTDVLLGGDKVVVRTQAILRPSFVLPAGLDAYGKQLTAESAQYMAPTADRPGGYLLIGVTSPVGLLGQPGLRGPDGRLVVATRREAPWLSDDQLFVVSDVSFELLAGGATWRDHASVAELRRELRSPSVELGPDVRVALHRRIVTPAMDLTLLMLGLPLVVSRANRNPFVAIGLCMLVVTAFFLVALSSQSLGAGGWVRPALAAWAPLLVFTPVAAGISTSLWR